MLLSVRILEVAVSLVIAPVPEIKPDRVRFAEDEICKVPELLMEPE